MVIHSSLLGSQRKEFEQLMGNTLVLVYEQTPCHQAIAESLSELKVMLYLFMLEKGDSWLEFTSKLNKKKFTLQEHFGL